MTDKAALAQFNAIMALVGADIEHGRNRFVKQKLNERRVVDPLKTDGAQGAAGKAHDEFHPDPLACPSGRTNELIARLRSERAASADRRRLRSKPFV